MDVTGTVPMNPPLLRRPARSGVSRRVRLEPGDAALTAGAVFLVFGVCHVLWTGSTLLLLAFLGVFLGVGISAGARVLTRTGVPHALGAVITLLGVLAVFGGIGALVAPVVSLQTVEIERRLPDAVSRASRWIRHEEASVTATTAPAGSKAAQAPAESGLAGRVEGGILGMAQSLFSLVRGTASIAVYTLFVLFVAIYSGAEPTVYRRGLLRLVPRRSRERAVAAMDAASDGLRKLLVTQLAAMLAIGMMWGVTLHFLDVRAALALAVVASVLEFIPTVGPALAAVPAVLMALLDSPAKALAVTVAYLCVQAIEAQILTPLLMKGRMNLPPVLTLLAQAVLSASFGFAGLLVAVPLTVVALAVFRTLWPADEPEPNG